MLLLQTLLVAGMVYFAPALAVRPQLILDPRAALAIPFVSVLIVFGVVSAMAAGGFYAPFSARLVAGVFALTAVVRLLFMARRSARSQWTAYDVGALGVALAFGVYLTLRILEGGFDEGDEIYSWNLWAIQHFLGEPIDYYYTQAPYPQLFPKILSFGYMVLGGVDAQAAVKTPLVIFPIALFFILGLAPNHKGDRRFLALQALLGLFLLKAVGFDSLFDNGMPDAMVTAAIAVSMFFLVLHQDDGGGRDYLVLSILTAAAAALSKQPGLVWALFSLPLLLAFGAYRKRNQRADFFIGLAPVAIAGLWLFTEGRGFQDNSGVAERSFGARAWSEQILHSLDQWLLQDPAILILLAAALVSMFQQRARRDILLLFALPSLLSWFLLAAYDLRAGAPALFSLAFLIAHAGYGLEPRPGGAAWRLTRTRRRMQAASVGALAAVAFAAGVYELRLYQNDHPAHRLGDTALSNLFILFGDEAGKAHMALHDSDLKLWTPTNYAYGIFYGRVRVMRPEDSETSYTPSDLLTELREKRPDFVTNGGSVAFGGGGAALDRLAGELCPALFERVAGPANKYGLILYKVNKERLDAGDCRP